MKRNGTAPMPTPQQRPQIHCVGHHATTIIADHMHRRATTHSTPAVLAALTRFLEIPGIQEKLINLSSPGKRTILVTAPSNLLLELHTHVLQNNHNAINELYLIHCKPLHKAG